MGRYVYDSIKKDKRRSARGLLFVALRWPKGSYTIDHCSPPYYINLISIGHASIRIDNHLTRINGLLAYLDSCAN